MPARAMISSARGSSLRRTSPWIAPKRNRFSATVSSGEKPIVVLKSARGGLASVIVPLVG